jgi:N-terminal 7TM region of histidine kinase
MADSPLGHPQALDMQGLPPLTNILLTLNELLAAAVLIVTFALLAYLVLQNRESPIARALCVLLGGIVVVFAGDVLIGGAQRVSTVQVLLRAQWLGIVSVPAGYVHLSHALLAYGGQPGGRRRWVVGAAYLVSVTFFLIAFGTDLLLRPEAVRSPLAQFGAGPLFPVFAVYFALACAAVLNAALRVRQMVLTPILRRRLTYLTISVLGPGLAVFPYLVVANPSSPTLDNLLLLLNVLGNAAITLMTLMTVYSIGFQGMALPDRIIRQDFVRWWLYGPVVGITIILFVRGAPLLAQTFALPRETLLIFGVMFMTVLMPIFVTRAKPYLDAIVYAQDHAEIDYLRALPRSTFTQADLRSLLENTLVVVCGALRIETAFVIAADETGDYTIKTFVGSRRDVRRFTSEHPLGEVVEQLIDLPSSENGAAPPEDARAGPLRTAAAA